MFPYLSPFLICQIITLFNKQINKYGIMNAESKKFYALIFGFKLFYWLVVVCVAPSDLYYFNLKKYIEYSSNEILLKHF